jgi:hypothetical protein
VAAAAAASGQCHKLVVSLHTAAAVATVTAKPAHPERVICGAGQLLPIIVGKHRAASCVVEDGQGGACCRAGSP